MYEKKNLSTNLSPSPPQISVTVNNFRVPSPDPPYPLRYNTTNAFDKSGTALWKLPTDVIFLDRSSEVTKTCRFECSTITICVFIRPNTQCTLTFSLFKSPSMCLRVEIKKKKCPSLGSLSVLQFGSENITHSISKVYYYLN